MTTSRSIQWDRFKHIVELANEGIWTLDADGRTDYINESGASMLGYKQEEMLNRPVTDFLFPDLGHEAEGILSEIKAGKEKSFEFQTRRRDGTLVWIFVSITPLSSGIKHNGALAIFSNITERKKAEEALRESEERFRIMADGSPNPIWVTDTKGERIFTNRRYQEFFGVSPEPTRDGNWRRLLHLDDESTYADLFMSALNERKSFSAEARVRRADGEWRWIESHAEPRYTRDGEFLGYVGISSDITEKKLAENALAENREMYRQLVESMTDGVVIHDGARILFMNTAGAHILGYAHPEDVCGIPPIDVVHPDYRKIASERIWDHRGKIQPLIEEKFLRKDGSSVDVDVITVPYKLVDSDGIQVIFRDITERKKYEEEIKRSRHMLELVLESVPVPVFWKDLDSKYLGCNRIAAQDAGLSDPREVVGKTDYDLAWRGSADLYRADDQEVIRSGIPKMNYEEPQVRTEGSTLWLKTNKVPLQELDGRIIGVLATYEDITERKRAEEALQKSETILREVITNLPIVLWTTDTDGVFTLSEGRGLRGLGLKPGKVKGRSAFDMYRKYPSITDAMKKALSGVESPFTVNIRGTTFQAWAVPLRDDRGTVTGLLGVAADITEQKKLEDDLKRSNEELQQFAYVASHDLQEPLRMVTAFLGLLNKKFGKGLPSEAQEYMSMASEGSVRMRELIDDLLQYSRLDSSPIELRKIDMNEVAHMVLETLNASIKEADAHVIVGLLPTVLADEKQMGQVLQNLISNAIKFRGTEPAVIEVSAAVDEKEFIFSVKDNGIGIDSRYADKLFKMFQRLHTNEEYPGTGIGLSISKKIIERHGGRIWFESEPGIGSTFYFTIPNDEADN